MLCTLINLYIIVVFARVLLEWIRVPGDHPVAAVRRALAAIVDPLLNPLRRVIPPLRFGGGALDLSPIVLFVVLSIVAGFVCR